MQLFRTSIVDVQAVARLLVRGTRRAVCTLIGFTLVAVGLAGLILPVLPGWLLIIGGFAVLSREYAWAQSGLAFARRHAARGGTLLRSLATRRGSAGADSGLGGSRVVIALRNVDDGPAAAPHTDSPRRASNLG